MYHPHSLQADITLAGNKFISIPRETPGRLNTDDFVFFNWPSTVNPNEYTVVVESMDTAGAQYRKVAPLSKQINLPFVQFDAHALIGVIPNHDERKPQFWARLNRGSTYQLPTVPRGASGKFTMQLHGVITASVNAF